MDKKELVTILERLLNGKKRRWWAFVGKAIRFIKWKTEKEKDKQPVKRTCKEEANN